MVTVAQALAKARKTKGDLKLVNVFNKKGMMQGTVVLKKDKRTRTGFRVKSWTWNKGSKTAKAMVLRKVRQLIKLSQG